MLGRRVDDNNIVYSNVMLPGPGKQGVLKKLDNGYYEILIGAFAAHGNGGWFYDLASAERYINSNPEFLFMLNNRRLRSEWGHPVREPGMSDADWLIRVNTVLEANWSSHIRAIRLSYNTVKDAKGRFVVAIIAEVSPTGPHRDSMLRILENPDEDLNYSIRSFAKRDFRNLVKHITKIITWDTVGDPGIGEISKYATPSMESKLSIVSPEDVSVILDQYEFNLHSVRDSLEFGDSDMSFESKDTAYKIIDSLYKDSRIVIPMPGQAKMKHLNW